VWLAGGAGQFVNTNRKGAAGNRAIPARDTGFRPSTGDTPEAVVDHWVQRLTGRPIAPEARDTLIEALNGQPNREDNVRRMVQLIVSMPDYQLC